MQILDFDCRVTHVVAQAIAGAYLRLKRWNTIIDKLARDAKMQVMQMGS